jgi:hypothetical protein
MRKWQKIQQKIDLDNLLETNTENEDTGDWAIHVKHLEEAHRVLELKLNEMENHPHVDESKVAELKRQKLKYKDEIQRLQQQHKGE